MTINSTGKKAFYAFVVVLLLAGLLNVFLVISGSFLANASVSGPISSPASPSPLPSTPVSAPVSPSLSPVASSTPKASASPAVSALPSPTSTPVSTTWKAEFFNNVNLKGKSVYGFTTNQINFNWLWFSPDSKVKRDNFSARFTTGKYFEAGRYKITTSSDDGMRIFMDGYLVHSAWYNQGAMKRSFEMDIPAGKHSFKVEYYEKGGLASVFVDFKKIQ